MTLKKLTAAKLKRCGSAHLDAERQSYTASPFAVKPGWWDPQGEVCDVRSLNGSRIPLQPEQFGSDRSYSNVDTLRQCESLKKHMRYTDTMLLSPLPRTPTLPLLPTETAWSKVEIHPVLRPLRCAFGVASRLSIN